MPNIAGYISGGVVEEGMVYSGAFYAYGSGIGGAGDATDVGLAFDAWRFNNIYGASETVQPPALRLIPQIKF